MQRLIITNILSGLSLVTLIVFSVQYLIFKNTPIYSDYKIEIINNPITGVEDIKFAMIGTKNLDCFAENVYGIASNNNGHQVILDHYTSGYLRNTIPGEKVTNSWSYSKPLDLTKGIYHVTMVGDWTCRFWIFNETTTRTYDNILLIVE